MDRQEYPAMLVSRLVNWLGFGKAGVSHKQLEQLIRQQEASD